jgi:hypothetical protein
MSIPSAALQAVEPNGAHHAARLNSRDQTVRRRVRCLGQPVGPAALHVAAAVLYAVLASLGKEGADQTARVTLAAFTDAHITLVEGK